MFKHLFVILTLLAPVWAWAQTPLIDPDMDYYKEQCKYIGSDYFGGRRPMTSYETITTSYLADEMKRLGLQPAFGDSYLQTVQVISTQSVPRGRRIQVKGAKGTYTMKFPDDVVIWTHRGQQKVEMPQTEYVFVGFGIDAPEYDWNDFDAVDVKGKIIISMVNDPGYYDKSLFRGENMTYYGRWIYKLEEAKRRGAAGCLVLHNTAAASYAWNVCAGHEGINYALYSPEDNDSELAFCGWLQEDAARRIFEVAGEDFDAALSAAKRPGFKAIPLKAKSSLKMDVDYSVGETQNVAAILPGTDLKDELLVYNAHWDHFGYGEPDEKGDSIYNGAADNASGIAMVLTLAKKFLAMPERPRRSIMFLSVTCEESGLFGSAYYCNHPADGFPMDKTVAIINFDCIAPMAATHDVPILGGGECDLDLRYQAAAAAQGRYTVIDNNNQDGWFFRSDHHNFIQHGVPAVVIRNGKDYIDPEVGAQVPSMLSWYHRPCDEYSDDWELSGTEQLLRLSFSVGLGIVNGNDRPYWFKKRK